MTEKATPTGGDKRLSIELLGCFALPGEYKELIDRGAALIAADREEERAEALKELNSVADGWIAENAKLRELSDAATDYIEKTPCDPDIYPDQWAAYQRYKKAREALKGGE